MKKSILIIFCLGVLLLVAGCSTVKNSKVYVLDKELINDEATNLTLEIIYESQLGGSPIPQSFSLQFITGKHLEVKNERHGQEIKSDIAFNVTDKTVKSYYLVAKDVYSGQEVETVEVVLISNDGTINQRLRSDFILIKSR